MNDRDQLLIRFLHFSASTATGRHDSHRAGLGIVGFLGEICRAHSLPLRWQYCWALPSLTDRAAAAALLGGDATMFVLGSPTYGQGSPWYLRRFFELTSSCPLWGKLGSAWATSGGLHTGGEMVIADTLRSLQGLGACTFSFAQKSAVFGTNQKFLADGMFDLIDVWFMDHFARTLALQALTRQQPHDNWAGLFNLQVDYYRDFPSEASLLASHGAWRDALNSPLRDAGGGYEALSDRVGFNATPADGSTLPFAEWLPPPAA